MKYLIITLLALTVVTSCKKDPTKKAFLYGRLVDNCNGNPIANQKVDFYQNFKNSTSWLVSDTEEQLLESTTTNSEGYFYFSGDDYTNASMSSYLNSSIRIQTDTSNLRFADGSLGIHHQADETQYSHQNVGDLFLYGMQTDIQLKIENSYNSITYDSILVSSSNGGIIITNSPNGWFETTMSNETLHTKAFFNSSDENDEKYQYLLQIRFYKDGQIAEYITTYHYIESCTNSTEIVFEFE